jgi:DNA mismatch endonuclease (patch repair protein)
MPKSNRKYWVAKLKRNVEHFTEVRRELRRKDWKVVVVWECQTKNIEKLAGILGTKLGLESYIN